MNCLSSNIDNFKRSDLEPPQNKRENNGVLAETFGSAIGSSLPLYSSSLINKYSTKKRLFKRISEFTT